MIHYSCDACGTKLEKGKLRYVAQIDVYAAYDTLEIKREDLERDLNDELREMFKKMKDLDPEELLRDVYANFKFDLCPACHGRYVKDPLAGMTPDAK